MKKKVPGADETFLKHEKSVCCFATKNGVYFCDEYF